MNIFNLYGLAVVVLMLIPNIVYARKVVPYAAPCDHKLMQVIEQIGRYGCMFFLIINIGFSSPAQPFFPWIISVAILFLLYWVFWALYLKRQTMSLALLLALVPSAIFILSGILLVGWPLIICGALFAVGHLFITCRSAKAAHQQRSL